MSVRLQCPHCRAVCQVPDEHRGKQVKCGQCNRTFAVPAGDVLQPAAAPGRNPPAPATPQTGGFWAGLRSIYQSIAGPSKAGDEEVSFELDGPAAAELERAAAQGVEPSAALPGVCRLDIGAATSPGRVRDRNEDSFLVQQLSWSNLDRRHEAALLVVADGMGGYEAGDQASGMIIRALGASLARLLTEQLADTPQPAASPPAASLDAALKAVNRSVRQRSQADPGCKGMGATAAALFVRDGEVQISHVGDCRVYHWRADKLTQVTRDQTLVARMVELGHLSEEEAETHPKRNEVTQALGKQPDLEPAAYQLSLQPGDWLIAACDGLHAHVGAPALASALHSAVPSAAAVAQRLVQMANDGGGSDNCTVIALRAY